MNHRLGESIHGFDETFKVAFNDVDFCLRVREAGKLIVWTPYAELYHYESKSRGSDSSPENIERFHNEISHIASKWEKTFQASDPYYNINLSLSADDFGFRRLNEPNMFEFYKSFVYTEETSKGSN